MKQLHESITTLLLIISLKICEAMKCLDQDTRINLGGIPMFLPHCWPLNTTSSNCNWCSNECFPVPTDSDMSFCKEEETCCQHECGTFCTKKLLDAEPPVKACVDPNPRIACPPLESFPKCTSCENRCKSDVDCGQIGGGGRICCPTRCGRRCHETLIF